MTTDIETIGILRNSFERYTAENYSFIQRQELPSSASKKVWSELADFGFLALRLPIDADGLDGDATAVGALMEVIGRRLMQEPFLESAILSTSLVARLGSREQRERLLGDLASGHMILVCALENPGLCVLKDKHLSGRIPLIMHGDIAHGILVTSRDEKGELRICLVKMDQDAVERSSFRLIDGRGAASIVFDSAEVELLETINNDLCIEDNIELLLDEANVALCAEACGVIQALLEATNEYLKIRTQFGKPLAVNQALQHRMADMYLLSQESLALTRAAEQILTGSAAERERLVSGARAYVSNAARQVANEAVQMHGGLGVTEELDVSHYFRRVMLLNTLFGGRDRHFLRFIEHSLG